MKFTALPVHDLTDVTLDLEQLQALLGSSSTFLQTGGATVRSKAGTGTLTWPAASPFSNVLTIAMPGATGSVVAVASPLGYVGNPTFFDASAGVACLPNGSGGVGFQAETRAAGNPGVAGTMTFAYLMWGT